MACDKDLHTAFILFSPPQNTSLLQVFILWELLTHVYVTAVFVGHRIPLGQN